uniref:RRM domain-containing protein n=1 Tax=Acrobeloides nanus TaxID=290746 RepID=A0A914EEE6_9BILA
MATITERHTIKVTNLPRKYDLLELRQALDQEFGNSKSIDKTATCPIKKLYVSKSKTEAFIKYFNSEDAENIVNMDGHYQIYGHELNVKFARSKPK